MASPPACWHPAIRSSSPYTRDGSISISARACTVNGCATPAATSPAPTRTGRRFAKLGRFVSGLQFGAAGRGLLLHLRDQGQRDAGDRPHAERAVDLEPTAVMLGQRPHQGQAEPGSLVFACLPAVDLAKRLHRDADALVAHAHACVRDLENDAHAARADV